MGGKQQFPNVIGLDSLVIGETSGKSATMQVPVIAFPDKSVHLIMFLMTFLSCPRMFQWKLKTVKFNNKLAPHCLKWDQDVVSIRALYCLEVSRSIVEP